MTAWSCGWRQTTSSSRARAAMSPAWSRSSKPGGRTGSTSAKSSSTTRPSHWATIAISGPGSKRIVGGARAWASRWTMRSLPHMGVAEGAFGGRPARIARVSFTGERSYEISVPAKFGDSACGNTRAMPAPLRWGSRRSECCARRKAIIYVGQDTDGETMPHDLGMAGPRSKRQDSYVGDRSLFTPAASRSGPQDAGRHPGRGEIG